MFKRSLTLILTLVLAACGKADVPDEKNTLPAGNITGTILTTSGNPLANAAIIIQPHDPALNPTSSITPQANSAYTDENGSFGVNLTQSGTYSLEATGDSEGVFTTFTAALQNGEVVGEHLELSSQPYGTVILTAHTSSGDPAQGVHAYLGGTNHIGLTNNDGKTVITRIPAGTYSAYAQANAGTRSEPQSIKVESSKTSESTPLRLKSLTPVIHTTPKLVFGSGPVDLEYGMSEYGTTFTITGENFGDTQALSTIRVSHDRDTHDLQKGGGWDQSPVLSWSDKEIIVFTDLSDYHYQDRPDSDLTIQVITLHGASNPSDRIDFANFELTYVPFDSSYVEGSPVEMLFYSYMYSTETPISGLAFNLIATKGTLSHSTTAGAWTGEIQRPYSDEMIPAFAFTITPDADGSFALTANDEDGLILAHLNCAVDIDDYGFINCYYAPV